MTQIEVQGLVKRYGDRTAVDGVDLSVRRGEIFGILGPNGAGKTTTVECIEGLRTPDSGTVRVCGLDPQNDSAELRHVLGAQLQESELPDKITVGEAMELYGSFYRDPADWRGLIADLGLTDRTRTQFRHLSGGQKQRLSIALAVIGNPRVAVLDELRLEAALDENAELHARLMARAREAGVLDERQRMAREIHDTLAQGLAGILSQLEAAEHSSGDPAAARRHTATAMSLAREGLSEARRTVRAVEPQALSEARLPDAVARIVERWSGIHGVAADLTVTGDPRPMHTDVEAALLRAAQEALSNVAKHAEAGRVGLTLSYMEDVVTLDVRDDGTGFVPGDGRNRGPGEGGFGLVAMRQRVRRLAGRVHVESEPGGGTAVSVSVPATPAGGGTP